jgi:hypothetical protein
MEVREGGAEDGEGLFLALVVHRSVGKVEDVVGGEKFLGLIHIVSIEELLIETADESLVLFW